MGGRTGGPVYWRTGVLAVCSSTLQHNTARDGSAGGRGRGSGSGRERGSAGARDGRTDIRPGAGAGAGARENAKKTGAGAGTPTPPMPRGGCFGFGGRARRIWVEPTRSWYLIFFYICKKPL